MWTLLVNDVRRVLTLLSGFTIGMHIAVFLHELGHAIGYLLAGGRVTAIVMLSPMPAGYVHGNASNQFFYVWGGVVFGSLSAVAPLALGHWLANKSVLRFLALMTAAFCLGHNSLYLFVGGLVPYADALGMIRLGAPQWLLVLFGIPLVVGFIMVLSMAIQSVGVHPAEPLWRWIAVVESGLLLTPATMVVVLGFDASVRYMLPSMLLLVCAFAICFAVAAWRARRRATSSGASSAIPMMPQAWRTTFALLAAAALLIAIEWLALGQA